jgi:hypothetical protein
MALLDYLYAGLPVLTRSITMKTILWFGVAAFALTLGFGSSASAQSPQTEQVPAQADDSKIHDNLAKLSPDDRKLAEAQKFCAVEEENRLGAMGKPVKVMLKGETVFLCCKGCVKQAKADPDKILAKAKELKEKNSK